MPLALIVALPFVGAVLAALMIRAGRGAAALAAGAANALALVMLCLSAPAVFRGEVLLWRLDWLPLLGLNANFMLDGLGLLFAGLILGIGLLIVLYARFYLSRQDPAGQFYAFLMLFQGAMTGLVLSDNVLLLLVFWELTSLSSFLLIGFWKDRPEGRQGARMALAVTAAGGLAMIAGMLILGQVAGSYDLSVILTAGPAIRASEWYLPALLLILAGAFTKSAQFPFHFWLPHAMAAPTPVSAYLHSATMVKAGLYLMARLWPVLAGTDAWFLIVSAAGLVTMVLGAAVALFRHDLKALLAYSTVSHLGLVTMLLGFGTAEAAAVAMFHIVNHATFKAALFMAAGIVEHEAGTRDIRRLGGLWRLMPVTFVVTALAGLSMAGVPPLNGFLSKELMLGETARLPGWAVLLATIGAGLSVAYSLRLVAGVFLGAERYETRPHDPPFGMWAAPALLAALVVLIGLWPMATVGALVDTVAAAVTGAPVHLHIAHWHGPAPALFLSLAAFGIGLVLLGGHGRLQAIWDRTPRPDAKRIFDALMRQAGTAARALTDGLHDGALTRYLAIATLAIVGAGVLAFAGGSHAPGLRAPTPAPLLAWLGWFLLVAATVALTLLHRHRLLALVFMGVVGLMNAVGFAWLSAPDLALTQIAVEVVTIVLFLLSLNFLPKLSPAEDTGAGQVRDLALAGIAGAAVAALAWLLMTRDFAFPPISDWHWANSYIGGGGNNAVNVIIVDFRGYDTFGEITVLGIAALAIFAITETLLRPGPANDRLLAWPKDSGQAGDRHPLVMAVAARVLLPFALVVGVYIYLRGHNEPGGGFVAGLVVSIALVMQYMASGFAWTQARQRIDYHAIIGAGVLTAGLCGLGAWFSGTPFLTSAFGYVKLPGLEKFELATAMIFDLGVFLAVVGAVMLTLASLTRISIRAGNTVNPEPLGIDPSRGEAG